MIDKQIYYKLFSNTGSYVETFYDFVAGEYSSSINAGYSDMRLQIPKQFDEALTGINFNGYVQRFVSDGDGSDILTYTGYISSQRNVIKNQETVEINLAGYYSKLTQDIFFSGNNLTVPYNTDTGLIARNILAQYVAQNTGTVITYSSSTIANTNITRNILFSGQTYADCLNDAKDWSGANYYFFLDNDNKVYLKTVNTTTTPTHYFVLGRDIIDIEYTSSIEQMKTGVYFWNSLATGNISRIMKLYTASTRATYGRIFELRKDGRYTQSVAMDAWASKYLTAYGNPIDTITLRIADNNTMRYNSSQIDIENVGVGDTFQILNIEPDSPLAGKVYYITSVTDYQGQYITVKSVDPSSYVAKELVKLNQKQQTNDWGVTYNQTFTT